MIDVYNYFSYYSLRCGKWKWDTAKRKGVDCFINGVIFFFYIFFSLKCILKKIFEFFLISMRVSSPVITNNSKRVSHSKTQIHTCKHLHCKLWIYMHAYSKQSKKWMFTRLRSIKNTTTSLFRYTNATRSCDFGKKNEQVYHKHHQNRRRRPPYPNTHSRKCDFAYQILNRKMVVIENFAEPNRLLDTLLSIVCLARKVSHLQKAHECNAYL